MARSHTQVTHGINTGFVYYRPTYHTKIFLQTLVHVSALKTLSDQALFNTLLRHWRFAQLHWRTLPSRLFPEEGRRCWGPSQ